MMIFPIRLIMWWGTLRAGLHIKDKTIVSISILLLLLLALAPTFSGRGTTNYASGLSCPTSETLRLTTFPLPASFNMLTSTTLSGYIMAALLQNTVYPYVTF